jgi:uncharacterized protein
MTESDIIHATAQWIEQRFKDEPTGHDWWHTSRVWKMALRISANKGGRRFIIEMSALLHDAGDHKFHDGIDKTHETALYWLDQFSNVDKADKAHIAEICELISFKGAGTDTTMPSLEGKIVQDADRIDALGAIGIARAFAYGGMKGRKIFDPAIKPHMHVDFDTYRKAQGTTINHFYEKLLLLENRMQTETGRQIAASRTVFLREFLQRFHDEWNI